MDKIVMPIHPKEMKNTAIPLYLLKNTDEPTYKIDVVMNRQFVYVFRIIPPSDLSVLRVTLTKDVPIDIIFSALKCSPFPSLVSMALNDASTLSINLSRL